jgi:hypothetical protein
MQGGCITQGSELCKRIFAHTYARRGEKSEARRKAVERRARREEKPCPPSVQAAVPLVEKPPFIRQ